jgi:protein subunit release factor B
MVIIMEQKNHLFSITKKDFIVQTFRAGGKGGQKQNKTSSGVRIIHPESGARGESREERSQTQNKKNAFERLIKTKEFKLWHKMKAVSIMLDRKDLEKQVNNMMIKNNLKIEMKDENGKWIEMQ